MKKTQRAGEKAERFFYNLLKEVVPGLSPTSNSGARFGNGDLGSPDLYIEVKSSRGGRFHTITHEEMEETRKKAWSLGKDYAFALINGGGEYGIFLPGDLAAEALKRLYKPPA